jgi:transposase-like protein
MIYIIYVRTIRQRRLSLSCGRCDAPTLTHLGRHDRRDDDSLLATTDRYRCRRCGAAGTYYVYTDGTVVLTDCLDARGHS